MEINFSYPVETIQHLKKIHDLEARHTLVENGICLHCFSEALPNDPDLDIGAYLGEVILSDESMLQFITESGFRQYRLISSHLIHNHGYYPLNIMYTGFNDDLNDSVIYSTTAQYSQIWRLDHSKMINNELYMNRTQNMIRLIEDGDINPISDKNLKDKNYLAVLAGLGHLSTNELEGMTVEELYTAFVQRTTAARLTAIRINKEGFRESINENNYFTYDQLPPGINYKSMQTIYKNRAILSGVWNEAWIKLVNWNPGGRVPKLIYHRDFIDFILTTKTRLTIKSTPIDELPEDQIEYNLETHDLLINLADEHDIPHNIMADYVYGRHIDRIPGFIGQRRHLIISRNDASYIRSLYQNRLNALNKASDLLTKKVEGTDLPMYALSSDIYEKCSHYISRKQFNNLRVSAEKRGFALNIDNEGIWIIDQQQFFEVFWDYKAEGLVFLRKHIESYLKDNGYKTNTLYLINPLVRDIVKNKKNWGLKNTFVARADEINSSIKTILNHYPQYFIKEGS